MRPMRCTAVRRRLSAYQDGELGQAQREAVREHLAHCAECRAAAADLRRAWELLGVGVGEEAETSPGFLAEVMGRIDGAQPRPAWQAPRWAVAAAIVLCLTFGGVAGYVHSRAPSSPAQVRLALAADLSRQMGLGAFAPSPADTLAGVHVEFTGNGGGR